MVVIVLVVGDDHNGVNDANTVGTIMMLRGSSRIRRIRGFRILILNP